MKRSCACTVRGSHVRGWCGVTKGLDPLVMFLSGIRVSPATPIAGRVRDNRFGPSSIGARSHKVQGTLPGSAWFCLPICLLPGSARLVLPVWFFRAGSARLVPLAWLCSSGSNRLIFPVFFSPSGSSCLVPLPGSAWVVHPSGFTRLVLLAWFFLAGSTCLVLSACLPEQLFPDVLIYWSFAYLVAVVALVARGWRRVRQHRNVTSWSLKRRQIPRVIVVLPRLWYCLHTAGTKIA